MIKSNSSVIIKNHERKRNEKCSKDSENTDDDEEGDNTSHDIVLKEKKCTTPMSDSIDENRSKDVKGVTNTLINKIENYPPVEEDAIRLRALLPR